MSKVVEYVGFFHALKDRVKDRWTEYWESRQEGQGSSGGGFDAEQDRETNFRVKVKERLEKLKHRTIQRIDRSSSLDQDFSHLTRPKTSKELLQISAAVMGIEFSYAAETAFVSPLLLNIGLRHRHMTLMWCLSPLIGFFVTPLLGSLSDGCRSQLGRRRPFILLLSIGIILGLLLVPNGKALGRLLGDTYKDDPKKPQLFSPAKIHSPWLNDEIQIPQNLLRKDTTTKDSKSEDSDWKNETGYNINLTNRLVNWTESENSENSEKSQEESQAWAYKQEYYSKYAYGKKNNLEENDEEEAQEFVKSLRLKDTKLKLTRDDFNKLGEQGQNQIQAIPQIDEDFHGGIQNPNSEEKSKSHPEINQDGIKELKVLKETESGNKSSGGLEEESPNEDEDSILKHHPWGLVFTVLGTVLLDFNADACQSPSRAYMLDVTIPDDHARGLSTFTVMAGLGGSLGYALGALNWENTFIGHFFGGQVRAVFTLVLFIFIACVITTIRSFREIPIDRLWADQQAAAHSSGGGFAPGPSESGCKQGNINTTYARFEEDPECPQNKKRYGSVQSVHETSFTGENTQKSNGQKESAEEIPPTFKEYVKTIIQLPKSLQWLCVTNFFCWMSLVCYSLYFTDFVGEAVFQGDPAAPLGSDQRTRYDEGVRFGCWGMSLYSLSCSIYSLGIERLVSRFGAKRVYITGQLVYSVGMVLMAITRHRFGVIVFSWTAGIMYATLFTMPYLLVARYHAAETFDVDIDDLVETKPTQMRGLGTDVAIVSSMVFLAQMTQALTLGSVVAAVGSTTAIICAAAVFAACGSLAACNILYLDI